MAEAAPLNRRAPRWWRRVRISVREANLYLALEIAAALALVAMVTFSWLAVSARVASGQLLPAMMAAGLLVGTLAPAMALIVLFGRRAALRRARQTLMGSTGRLHVRLVFLFSLIAAVPTLLVVI